MAKEQIDGKKGEKAKKSRNPKIEFNKLQMYFGKDYTIDLDSAEGSITIVQPTLGDIINIGEEIFYSSLSPLVTNTTSYKVMLWDMDIDWTQFSDFQLFLLLYKGISPIVSKLLFSGVDISTFEIGQRRVGEENRDVLYDSKNNIEINEEVYFHISQYLRKCFQINPEEKMTTDGMLKKMWVNLERNKMNREKDKEQSNSIQSVISACVNHPGFKYKLSELEEIHIYEFYDSVARLQIYENSTALLKGMYSGMIDASKIDANSYNFMR